jgi:AcrR family transcriptional regulator
MARPPAPGTRDRILDSAGRLFRQHGAPAVGTQQIIEVCGCGKNLLYREFASKDELVAAYLERCQTEWAALMKDATRSYAGDPAQQLVALVRAAAGQVADPNFQGCPFRTAHAQFPDPEHPANQVATRHLQGLRSQLRALARRAEASDPHALADRLMLIIDGLYTNGSILGRRGAAPAAVAFAETVVRDATGSTAG